MDNHFIARLKEMAEKYSVAEQLEAELAPGAVKLSCSRGRFCFFYDFSREYDCEGYESVPLFHWQAKRRYSELRGLLDRKVITPALAMRCQHIVPPGEFAGTLKDLMVFEAGLLEFITRSRVERVFADFTGEQYTNCILSTDSGVKAGVQLGFSPEGSESVLLHEVVARTGTASDLPVDTQMTQYPIYVLKGPETEVYNDIDFELYGLENTQADCIRFILWALADAERPKQLQNDYRHLENVFRAAAASSRSLRYTPVEV